MQHKVLITWHVTDLLARTQHLVVFSAETILHIVGEPCATRTRDTLLKRQVLFLLS